MALISLQIRGMMMMNNLYHKELKPTRRVTLGPSINVTNYTLKLRILCDSDTNAVFWF